MSKRLKQLQNDRATIVKKMEEMEASLASDGRNDFTPDEDALFVELKNQLRSTKAAIEVAQAIQDAQKELAAVTDQNAPTATQQAQLNGHQKPKAEVPITAMRIGQLKAFSGPDAELHAYQSGMFLKAALLGNSDAQEYCREHGIQYLAHSSSGMSTGGVLVPEVLLNTVIVLREQYGVFRRFAQVIPIGTESVVIPRQAGGLTAYFPGQNQATTESEMSWDAATLTAKELAVLTRYPNTLAADAIIALADTFARDIAYAFALKEDQCGFIGDGTSTYGGIYGAATKINDGTHAASIYTAATGNVSFETLDLDDFLGAMSKLPEYAKQSGNTRWYISSAGFAMSMARLMYNSGGNTVDTVGGGTGPSFLGYPVVISQVLNSTLGSDTSKIKCLFGDLSLASALGSRQDVTIEGSRERYFEYRQSAIQGVERFDINNHDLGDGSTAGPLVALKSAAS